MNCIKCNKELPEGELFCEECALNIASEAAEDGTAVLLPKAKGRMQAPQRPKRPAPRAAEPEKGRSGLKTALVIVSLLLVGALALMLWQYQQLRVEKAGLLAQEADLEDREEALEELQLRIEELENERETLKTTIADRELKIEDLEARLSGSQSSQSQTQYDLTTKQAEIDRLKQERSELQKQVRELETQLEELTETQEELAKALQAAEPYKEKANFMDTYVVFVENNGTGYYHTYDCAEFSRTNFWAYSRKLAESNSYKPCPKCGGKP